MVEAALAGHAAFVPNHCDLSPDRRVLLAAANRHAEAPLPYVAGGNYLGEHWLASFAVYMLTERTR